MQFVERFNFLFQFVAVGEQFKMRPLTLRAGATRTAFLMRAPWGLRLALEKSFIPPGQDSWRCPRGT
jgi:hypothetical protein